MKLTDMKSLLIHELKDLLHAEKQLTKALPRMAKAATDEELRQALQEHLSETEQHVVRLEKALEDLGVGGRAQRCEAMEGLIKEGSAVLGHDSDPSVRDAAIVAAAQRVEHYEIAGYGCARTIARQLGYDRTAELLQTTLDEEGEADKKLTQIVESRIYSGQGASA